MRCGRKMLRRRGRKSWTAKLLVNGIHTILSDRCLWTFVLSTISLVIENDRLLSTKLFMHSWLASFINLFLFVGFVCDKLPNCAVSECKTDFSRFFHPWTITTFHLLNLLLDGPNVQLSLFCLPRLRFAGNMLEKLRNTKFFGRFYYSVLFWLCAQQFQKNQTVF